MKKDCYLFREEHIPQQAAFPAIDAHNHLWGSWNAEKIVKVNDAVGIISYCDVSANVKIVFDGGGYIVEQGEIEEFFSNCAQRYPERFYCFTMAAFFEPLMRKIIFFALLRTGNVIVILAWGC